MQKIKGEIGIICNTHFENSLIMKQLFRGKYFKVNGFTVFPKVITAIFLLFFTSCYTSFQPVKSEFSTIRIDHRITEEHPDIINLISPYKSQLESEMSEVVAVLETELIRQKPESTLGNLVADILHEQAVQLTGRHVDFALQNYGGLRIGQIPAGPVTKGKIFELMPFENYLVVVEATGNDLLTLSEKLVEYGGWPVSFGYRLNREQNGEINLLINGEPVVNEKIYYVAMPDYIADGGDNSHYFVGKPRVNTGKLIRDILVSWFEDKGKSGETVKTKLDGRIVLN